MNDQPGVWVLSNTVTLSLGTLGSIVLDYSENIANQLFHLMNLWTASLVVYVSTIDHYDGKVAESL